MLSTDNKTSETREQDKRLQDLDSGISLQGGTQSHIALAANPIYYGKHGYKEQFSKNK